VPVKPYQPVDLSQPGIKVEPAPKVRPGQLSSNETMALRQILRGEVALPKRPAPVQEPITVPAPRKHGKDELKAGVQRLSQRLMDYLLDGDRLERLMAETKLKDLGVLLGITTEKLLLLEGAPTQIISHSDQKKMDEVLPALLQEIQRRGVRTELTERKISLEVPSSAN
jgi:hypothetical protein